jgi:hypothetical protein
MSLNCCQLICYMISHSLISIPLSTIIELYGTLQYTNMRFLFPSPFLFRSTAPFCAPIPFAFCVLNPFASIVEVILITLTSSQILRACSASRRSFLFSGTLGGSSCCARSTSSSTRTCVTWDLISRRTERSSCGS